MRFTPIASRIARPGNRFAASVIMSATSLAGRPLSLRVLELGELPAAAYASRFFADFGADVLKVEIAGR